MGKKNKHMHALGLREHRDTPNITNNDLNLIKLRRYLDFSKKPHALKS